MDGDNFFNAFAGAQVHISHITSGKDAYLYALVLLQNLCTNCQILAFTLGCIMFDQGKKQLESKVHNHQNFDPTLLAKKF